MKEKNDLEYDIVDSMQCSLSYAKQEEENTFCNSQDFFMSQEIEITKKQSQEDVVEEELKITNEEKDEITDFESSEEILNKKRTPRKKSTKVFQGRQKRSAAGNSSEQEDAVEEELKILNEEKDEITDFESSEEILNKKRTLRKKSTKVFQGRQKRSAAGNSSEQKNKQDNKKSTTGNSLEQKSKKDDKKQSSSIKNVDDCKNIKFNLSGDEKKVFDFFFNINRPVSSTELTLNFKKQISLVSLTGICSQLEEKNLIIIKLYAKTKVYMIHPSVFDSNESEENKNKLKILKEENDRLKNEFSLLTQEYKNLKNMDTEEEINEKIKKYKMDLELLQIKVKARDDGELVSKKEIEKFEEKIKKYEKIKKSREKLLNEILGILSENMNVKKSELIEELEFEM